MNRATNGKPFRDTFAGTQVFATPNQCVNAVRTIVNSVDAREFVAVFRYGGMRAKEAERAC